MSAQKVTVTDYRKANAANSLLPKPSILSSSGWSNLYLEVYQQPKFEIAEHQLYSNVLCPDIQAVAQTVLDALEGDPAIVPAHRVPLVQAGDAARVRTLVKLLTLIAMRSRSYRKLSANYQKR